MNQRLAQNSKKSGHLAQNSQNNSTLPPTSAQHQHSQHPLTHHKPQNQTPIHTLNLDLNNGSSLCSNSTFLLYCCSVCCSAYSLCCTSIYPHIIPSHITIIRVLLVRCINIASTFVSLCASFSLLYFKQPTPSRGYLLRSHNSIEQRSALAFRCSAN